MVFNKELEMIENEELRNIIEEILDKLPEKFYSAPASSSKKYHPKFSHCEGGLVKHTKASVRVGLDLLRGKTLVSSYMKDIVIASLLLHDGFKFNESSEEANQNHAVDMADHIYFNYFSQTTRRTGEQIREISSAIYSHMGKFDSNFNGFTKLGEIVHLADYIASRKYISEEVLENE